MKLLILSNMQKLSGGEITVLRLARSLTPAKSFWLLPEGEFLDTLRKDGQNTFVCPELVKLWRSENRWWILKVPRKLLVVLRHLSRVIREIKPDIIIANALGLSVYAVLTGYFYRRPLLVIQHSFIEKGSPEFWFLRLFGSRIDAIVAVSDAIAKPLRGALKSNLKVKVIHNALPTDSFVQLPRSGAQPTLNLESDQIVFGMVGTLCHWKGCHVLLEALLLLKSDPLFCRITVIFFGDASLGNTTDYQNMLHEFVISNELQQQVIFAGRYQDISTAYSAIDVLVNASVEPEPFGTSICEGMAFKKLIIASNAGGTPEIIEDGVTGYLVSPDDAGALAEKMSFLANNYIKLEHVRATAQAECHRRFNSRRIAKQYTSLLRDIENTA